MALERAATLMEVDPRDVVRARRLQRRAPSEVLGAVKAGRMTLDQAEALMVSKRKRPMGDVAVGFKGTAADAVAAGNEDVPTPSRSRRKDLEKVMYKLRADQAAALRAEAFRRAQKSGSGKPDASEVLREILDGVLDPAKVMKG